MNRMRTYTVNPFWLPLVFLLFIHCTGCTDGDESASLAPRGPDTEEIQSVQMASAMTEATNLITRAAGEISAVQSGVLGQFLSDGFRQNDAEYPDIGDPGFSLEMDKAVELSDYTLYGFGKIRFYGSVNFIDSLEGTGVLSIPELWVDCLTDVVYTDPVSGMEALFAEGDSFLLEVTGVYSRVGREFSTEFTLSENTGPLTAEISSKDGVIYTALMNLARKMTTTYFDDNILDSTSGVFTHAVNAEHTISWSDAQGAAHIVTINRQLDDLGQNQVDEILVSVDGESFGPYTHDGFFETFGVKMKK